MWQATYQNIDRGGLNPELKVTVLFSNGTNTIENLYEVLPADLDSGAFKTIIQNQIDILNSKEMVKDTNTLLETVINTELK